MLQAGRAAAQTVISTSIPLFGFTPANIILYGQNQTYVATLSVPAGSALPQGSIQFLNGSALLTTAPLSIGTTQGNNIVRCCTPPHCSACVHVTCWLGPGWLQLLGLPCHVPPHVPLLIMPCLQGHGL